MKPEMLWLLPGELPFLLGQLQVACPTTDSSRPWLQAGETERTLDQILDVVGGEIILPDLRASLPALLEPQREWTFYRGIHRQEPELWSLCEPPNENGSLGLRQSFPDGSLHWVFPFEKASFGSWLLEPLQHICLPDLPLPELPPLSLSQLTVLLGLADLFCSRYPIPDNEWLPDREFTFTSRELHESLDHAHAQADESSLVRGFANLSSLLLPPPNREELEFNLLLFASARLLKLEERGDGVTYFSLGLAGTWLIRCLAWWDLTFRLDALGPWQPAGLGSLMLIQASVLWRFEITEESETTWVKLQAIETQELERAIQATLSETSSAVSTLVLPPPVFLPKAALPSACVKCLAPLSPGAKFCRKCGTPAPMQAGPEVAPSLSPIEPACPQCGAPRAASARFCRSCGSKF